MVSSGVRCVTSRDPVELHLAADGEFPCSHPGQFAVSDVALTGGRRLTMVSLYGIWDLVGGSRDKYVEATLHRAISDLSVVFQEPCADLILVAGDFNLYSYRSEARSWIAACRCGRASPDMDWKSAARSVRTANPRWSGVRVPTLPAGT